MGRLGVTKTCYVQNCKQKKSLIHVTMLQGNATFCGITMLCVTMRIFVLRRPLVLWSSEKEMSYGRNTMYHYADKTNSGSQCCSISTLCCRLLLEQPIEPRSHHLLQCRKQHSNIPQTPVLSNSRPLPTLPLATRDRRA